MGTTIFDHDDLDLIVSLAGCTLDESPGSNWVQEAGGLPEYICHIARAVKRSGKTTSQAISIAVSRVKKWATGLGVNADTQAKATAALAQWEKLKAKAHATKNKNTVKATATADEILCFANSTSFNTDAVRAAFEKRERDARKAWRANNPNASYEDGPQYLHIRELWSDYLIVSSSYDLAGRTYYKIPYTVDTDNNVTFGDAVEVKTQYVAVYSDDLGDGGLTDDELKKLMELTGPCSDADTTGLCRLIPADTPLSRISLTWPGGNATALDRIVELAATAAKPFGNVTYADPGYQADGKSRYPIDTEAHVRAAWSYINQADNAKLYNAKQLATVKAKIRNAAKRFGITIGTE